MIATLTKIVREFVLHDSTVLLTEGDASYPDPYAPAIRPDQMEVTVVDDEPTQVLFRGPRQLPDGRGDARDHGSAYFDLTDPLANLPVEYKIFIGDLLK